MPDRTVRWLKPVIYVHVVVVLGVAIAVFLLQLVPLTKQEPVLSSRMGDLYVALAAILVLVSARFAAAAAGCWCRWSSWLRRT